MGFRRAAIGLSGVAILALAAPPSAQRTFRDSERRYWAYQKVVKFPPPAVANRAWVRNEIDAFILAKLQASKIDPNPATDKVNLIRRVTLDLTGLPPTPEEVQDFLQDSSFKAYERVVDRLLASPHYGERWARHWLDLARYADSEGFKADETRPNIWRYRDYVIDSFNQDKPYDRFVKEQIAGDELYPDDPAAIVATGFNRHWPDESNMNNPIQRRHEILNDVTDTVGSVFLGLTYGCARCHDHKFDAILQKDYFRLQAFFANTRNEDNFRLVTGEKRRAYEEKRAAWESQTAEIRKAMDNLLATSRAAKAANVMPVFPPEVQAVFKMPPEKWTPFQRQMYYRGRDFFYGTEAEQIKALKGDDKKNYEELEKQLAKFDHLKPADPPIAQTMIDAGRAVPPTHLLARGAWESPEEEVEPGFLTILDPTTASIVPPDGVDSSGRRSALANWIADSRNPLTARVMVNRIWHYHFGRGIVGTPSDFGVMGDRPTHKELLDYLTASFVESGWSVKKMHRLIVLSNTYQQSSAWRETAAQVDPTNKLMWRFERRRLEGEAIRDAMLSVSSQLNTKMGGPGVFPPIPSGMIRTGSRYIDWNEEKDTAEANRRSVYIFVKRNLRYPMFDSFDLPDTHESCARRYSTVTPTQSLALMNSELVLQWAESLASQVMNDSGLSVDTLIDRAYRLVHTRQPKPEERAAIAEFFKSQTANRKEQAAPAWAPPGTEPAKALALVDLCHTLLNSNEFLHIN
jgi:hypothetical protein